VARRDLHQRADLFRQCHLQQQIVVDARLDWRGLARHKTTVFFARVLLESAARAIARWTLCWLLIIGVTTAGAYVGTNQLIAGSQPDTTFAQLPLPLSAGLGTPQCAQATRALVAAGEGTAASATPEQQAAYARAARTVLQLCA
jgi:hypothetical protein